MSSYRLHCGLRELGIDSQMLVARKKSHDDTVIAIEEGVHRAFSLFRIFTARSLLRCGFPDRHLRSLNLLPSFIGRRIVLPSSGITHLHWVHGEMMSLSEMSRLPGIVVWTLHDGWALEGTKHISLNEKPGYLGRLLEAATRARKQRHWRDWDVHLIAMCQEMKRQAEKHPILSQFPCEVLPNSVDVRDFFKVEDARELLGIRPKEIMFVFVYSGRKFEYVKGFDVVEHTVQHLHSRNYPQITLVIIGGDAAPEEQRSWGRILRPGYISSSQRMREWYSAADLLLAPSRYEPFGNSIIEAAACGLPCVAFRLGGPADTIENHVSGVLVEPEDRDAYAQAVQSLLEADDQRIAMGSAARTRARQLYSRDVVAKLHRDLYLRLIERAKTTSRCPSSVNL